MEKNKKLIIYGKGLTSELAYYYFQKYTEYDVVSFCTEKQFLDSTSFQGLPLVDFNGIEKKYSVQSHYFFIALGFGNINQDRRKIYFQVKNLGYSISSFVHPSVINESSTIGENCFIYENVVLQPFSIIEDNVTVAPLSLIGHHCIIKHSAFIASNVTLQGLVEIGENTFIGPNTNVLPKLQIGNNIIVLYNSIVSTNIPNNKICYMDYKNNIRDIKYAKLFKDFS